MSERNPLQDFFRAGDVPAADPDFRLSVMAGVARQRLRRELVQRLGLGVLLCLLAVVLGPVLGDVLAALMLIVETHRTLLALPLALAVALAGHVWLSGKLRLGLPGLR